MKKRGLHADRKDNKIRPNNDKARRREERIVDITRRVMSSTDWADLDPRDVSEKCTNWLVSSFGVYDASPGDYNLFRRRVRLALLATGFAKNVTDEEFAWIINGCPVE